ncbi:944_t:CDS:2 [Funneliformis geosporum]|uniref:944_t:CDS:1 n=1 Tax=Funneliformis geosporum TaxID=1117311 RepID=A0A9W4SQT1_9GLOM|nr:944_t:CDS:2 [Funneliformis geosporum]
MIDPEESRVAVPDSRFDWLCETYKPSSKVPAYLTVIDIAGLVKGAATGAGLGNNFLSHIRAVDAIFHVVRAFSEEDVIHVEGDLDPIRDLEIIHNELRLKDEEFLAKKIEELSKVTARVGKGGGAADKAKKEELEITQKLLKTVTEENKDVRKGDWNNKEVEIINNLLLLTAKPVIYLVNLSEKDYIRKKNKWLPKIKAWIDENNPGDLLLPFSASFESQFSALPTKEEKEKFMAEKDAQSALPRIIVAGYQSLQLMYFFTCGPDEVRAWTIRKHTKAPKAAGVIHSDFEKGFILVEIMRFNDLKELGSESAVKAAGKYIQKGKEYVFEDGDIAYFRSGLANKK